MPMEARKSVTDHGIMEEFGTPGLRQIPQWRVMKTI